MSGKRQPIELVKQKGKKHLTKAEIALREAQELHPDADKVAPPGWLDKAQKKRFKELAAQLVALKIMTNLDCEALARLIKAESDYIAVTQAIDEMPLLVKRHRNALGPDHKPIEDPETGEKIVEVNMVVNEERAALVLQQDKLWRQCRQGATDFGLNIAGRCRLVAPKVKEEKPENKFLKYAKGKVEA